MKPSQFKNEWGDDSPLVQYPEGLLDGLSLSSDGRRFLMDAGLPSSAAPFLSFECPDASRLPSVSEMWQLPEHLAHYKVIGSTGNGDPVCLDDAAACEVVYLDHDFRMRRVFINSSVPQLAASFLAYRAMVQDSRALNGPEALLDNDIPATAIQLLEQDLRSIDRSALTDGAFWFGELQELKAGPY